MEDPDSKTTSTATTPSDEPTIEEGAAAKALIASSSSESESSSVTVKPDSSSSSADGKSNDGKPAVEKKAPRKLVEDEKRATGRISKDIWIMYFKANGGWRFWTLFGLTFGIAMVSPLLENGWLRIWSASYSEPTPTHPALYYIGIYCLVSVRLSFFLRLRTLTFVYLVIPDHRHRRLRWSPPLRCALRWVSRCVGSDSQEFVASNPPPSLNQADLPFLRFCSFFQRC